MPLTEVEDMGLSLASLQIFSQIIVVGVVSISRRGKYGINREDHDQTINTPPERSQGTLHGPIIASSIPKGERKEGLHERRKGREQGLAEFCSLLFNSTRLLMNKVPALGKEGREKGRESTNSSSGCRPRCPREWSGHLTYLTTTIIASVADVDSK